MKIILSRPESYNIENYYNGIYRKIINNKFIYLYTKNNKEVSNEDYMRIKKLMIPPSWKDVWISNNPKTNIQVIGSDNSGKKQYKYNDEHIKKSNNQKFDRLFNFIKAMPTLEKNMKTHEKLSNYDKKKVIHTMLMIVKKLYMRVGKEEYARQNNSYGISSLEKKHIKIKNNKIKFKFKGKSKQILTYVLNDVKIAKHLKVLLKLDGDKLFQYIENDKIKKMSYMDLNEYMHEFMGSCFSVKDFRTYAANYYFIKSLIEETKMNYPSNNKIIKQNINNAIIKTAEYLRHTASISKKSYIMSFCVELYQTSPEFFIKNQDNDINDILLKIFSLYKKKTH
jgi:DNA topoisomerase-1